MHETLRCGPDRVVVACLAMFGLVAGSCSSGQDDAADVPASADGSLSGEVVVFAAASLTEAFTELGDAFVETDAGVSVAFNFAASSELAAQIIEGAPADVFASADLDNMARLTDADGNADEPVVFAGNLSQIVVAEGNPLEITGVDSLADDELIVVTCAPQVPCGAYAAEIFDNAGVEVSPASFEENVKGVVTKVALGEADAGIVYATDVDGARGDVDGVEIPADLNVVAEYPIVLTTDAPNPDGGRAFIDFVLGEAGQTLLASYGFTSP